MDWDKKSRELYLLKVYGNKVYFLAAELDRVEPNRCGYTRLSMPARLAISFIVAYTPSTSNTLVLSPRMQFKRISQ